jgi:predicted amidophosphoribosyltransferase
VTVSCPVCGATSETIYRCEECGKDLVGEQDDRDELVTDGGTSTRASSIAQIHAADRTAVDALTERAAHPEGLDRRSRRRPR